MTLGFKITGGTSHLGFQVWTAVRLGISSLNSCQTSDPRAHESKIQDPRFSKNFSWIQGGNLGSGSKIQDPRSKIFKTIFLDPGQKSKIQDSKDMRCNSNFRKTCRTPFRSFEVGKSLQNAAAHVIHSAPECKLQKVQKQIIPKSSQKCKNKRWHDLHKAHALLGLHVQWWHRRRLWWPRTFKPF